MKEFFRARFPGWDHWKGIWFWHPSKRQNSISFHVTKYHHCSNVNGCKYGLPTIVLAVIRGCEGDGGRVGAPPKDEGAL